jgi:hypothetical protein
MLTVTPICLAVIAFKEQPVTPAHAQQQTRVVIDSVNATAFQGVAAIPVRI